MFGNFRTVVLSFALACAFSGLASSGEGVPRLDRVWKRYLNRSVGFCLSYPGRWRKGDALDGAGFVVATGVKKYSLPIGSMDVTALPDEVPHVTPTGMLLTDDFRNHLEGLRK